MEYNLYYSSSYCTELAKNNSYNRTYPTPGMLYV